MTKIEQLREILAYVNDQNRSSLGVALSARHQTALTKFVEKDLLLRELIHRQKYLAKEIWDFAKSRGEAFFKHFITSLYVEFDYAKESHHESLSIISRVKKLRLRRVEKVYYLHFLLALLRAELETCPELWQAVDELEKFRTLLVRHFENRLTIRTLKASPLILKGAVNDATFESSISQDKIDGLVKLKTEHEELVRLIEHHKNSESITFLNKASARSRKNNQNRTQEISDVTDNFLTVQPEKVEKNSSEAQPLWIDRLDAHLTDEFRYHLKESITNTVWSDICHGDFGDTIKFFEYFDGLIQIVYDFREKPSQLRSYLEELNPTSIEYSPGGIAHKAAKSYLPVLRQQEFLLNALSIVIGNRCITDHSLRIPSSIMNGLVQKKVSAAIRTIGTMTKESAWQRLANRVDQHRSIIAKANEVVIFLTAVLEKHNLRAGDDRRDTLLFMREQLEIPYDDLARNSGRPLNVFGSDTTLQSFCASLYYEYHRLIELARLEQFEHKIPAGNDDPIHKLTQVDEGDADIYEGVEIEENPPTMRRKVLLLLGMTFGKFELPQEIVKTKASEVFHPLVGGNKQNFYALLLHPTRCKSGARAIRSLCDDLHFVRNELSKVGLTENAASAISEIEALIEEMEEE